MSEQPVSVLMPVHHTETPAHLATALESIHDQTHAPAEIVVVKDETTSAPELDGVIEAGPETIRVERIEYDHTLGHALQRGLEGCENPVVARMDSDDVSESDRLAKQVEFLASNPEVDVVGSYIAEFVDDPTESTGVRKVPTDSDEIRRSARIRCPMNHPSVTYRKEAVLAAGGYRDVSTVEDYDLWARMLVNGSGMANIPEVLVHARAGESLYRRRGGVSYARSEYGLQRRFLEQGFVGYPTFIFNIAVRVPVRLVPNQVRERLYRIFLRD